MRTFFCRMGCAFYLLLGTGCASHNIYSSDLLLKSVNEELQTVQGHVKHARESHQTYFDATRALIKNQKALSPEKRKAIIASLGQLRKTTADLMRLESQIQNDRKALQKAIGKRQSISAGSEGAEKLSPQLEIYGNGQHHPEVAIKKKAHEDAVKGFNSAIAAASGYMAETKSLQAQLQPAWDQWAQKAAKIQSLSTRLSPGLSSEWLALQDKAATLRKTVESELAHSQNRLILVPGMAAYSALDQLTTLYEELESFEKKIP